MTLVEFDQFITPDGVIYNLEDLKDRAIIGSVGGHGMPPIEYQTQRGPQQHGETVIGYRLSPRIMQMVYRRNGCDRQDYWNHRLELLDVLRPNRMTTGSKPIAGTLRKILPDRSRRDIDVLIEQGPSFEGSGDQWDEWAFEEALRFVAYDPTFYDPTLVTTTVSLPVNNQLSFPASFPISFGASSITTTVAKTYIGTWLTYPIIHFSGPLTAVIITNLTTNESVQFAHVLAAGQTATMDLRFGFKTVLDGAGNNLIGSVSGDIGTFHLEAAPLAPGGVNQLQFYVSAIGPGGVVEVDYYTRYVGI